MPYWLSLSPQSFVHNPQFLLDPGWEVFPNFYHNIMSNRVKAMHGYMPGKPYSDGILISNKRARKKNYRITDIRNLVLGD